MAFHAESPHGKPWAESGAAAGKGRIYPFFSDPTPYPAPPAVWRYQWA